MFLSIMVIAMAFAAFACNGETKEVEVEVPVEKVGSVKLVFPEKDEESTTVDKDYFSGSRMRIYLRKEGVSVKPKLDDTHTTIEIYIETGDNDLKDAFDETDRSITLTGIPCAEYSQAEFTKENGGDGLFFSSSDKFTVELGKTVSINLDYN